MHPENREYMPLRHRLEKKLAHEVDIKGIAVALAFLLSVSLLAGSRDNPSVNEDRHSPSVSMQIAPILTREETETLQPSDEEADLSDTSHKFSTFR
jgi:hypothetical protein